MHPSSHATHEESTLSLRQTLQSKQRRISQDVRRRFPTQRPSSRAKTSFLRIIPVPIIFQRRNQVIRSYTSRLPQPTIAKASICNQINDQQCFTTCSPQRHVREDLSLPSRTFRCRHRSRGLRATLPQPTRRYSFHGPTIRVRSFMRGQSRHANAPLFRPLFQRKARLRAMVQ